MAQEDNSKVHARLVFARHGESQWNNLNKFTGWVDCDLSETGIKEAHEGGQELKKRGFSFDIMYTSYLKRAIKTGNIMLDELDQHWIPVEKSWRLNERMYGALTGLNKKETVDKHGKDQVLIWRRSFDVPPPEIEEKSEYNPKADPKYAKLDAKDVPKTECLKDVIARAMPFWESDIKPRLLKGETVLVSAHGNSIRAILKSLDNIAENVIPGLEIPTGIPLLYEFDKDMNIIKSDNAVSPLTGEFLADPAKVKAMQDKVKNQIAKK